MTIHRSSRFPEWTLGCQTNDDQVEVRSLVHASRSWAHMVICSVGLQSRSLPPWDDFHGSRAALWGSARREAGPRMALARGSPSGSPQKSGSFSSA